MLSAILKQIPVTLKLLTTRSMMCSFNLLKPSPIYKNTMIHYEQRGFAKKKDNLKKKKEEKKMLKKELQKEYEGMDPDDFLKGVNTKFEAIVHDYRAKVKAMKIAKSNPKLIEKVTVYIEGMKTQINKIADISIKTADTICIIPRDPSYIDPILNVRY